ncbi:hypothetical protein [Bradyrhizobium elkanii]|uniref:hypothetical protein n=1 Tax=Bradyrhizobium elkanii TaxID=29448 RepID=UPI00209EDD68|nr:hypothetical protein [Bradyrhizobium elkanii]MCP1974299.1 hypothetical protein [Bradyrhizobium elkanii]MCS4104196.1 hypothetical protein [Bradyrhizobium elkanii]
MVRSEMVMKRHKNEKRTMSQAIGVARSYASKRATAETDSMLGRNPDLGGVRTMPIKRLLEMGKYPPEKVEILTKAFSLALGFMGLVDRDDPLCELVARKVIEVAGTGPSDPKQIAEAAVARIGLR